MDEEMKSTLSDKIGSVIVLLIALFFLYLAVLSIVNFYLMNAIYKDLGRTIEVEQPVSGSWFNYEWTTEYREDNYEKVASVSDPIEMKKTEINHDRLEGKKKAEMIKGIIDGLLN